MVFESFESDFSRVNTRIFTQLKLPEQNQTLNLK